MLDVARLDLDGELVLRAPREEDVAGVLAVHGDPRVYRHDPHETQTSLADAERFLAPFRAHWARHGFGYWAVLVPTAWWPTGVPGGGADDGPRVHAGIGGIQHYVMAGEPVLNVYFRLSPEVHGRGVGGLIVRKAQWIAPKVAPGLDLVVRTRPANAPARRVAEREGFVDVGLEPGSTDMQLLRWSPGSATVLG